MKIQNSQNIYNGLEFKKEPYSQNDKFSIFVAKDQNPNDPIIQREIQLLASKSQGPFFRPQQTQQNELHENPDQQAPQTIEHQIYEEQTQSPHKSPIQQQSAMTSPKHNRVNFHSPNHNTDAQATINPKRALMTSKNFYINQSRNNKRIQSSTQIMIRNKQMTNLRESLYFDEKTKAIPKSTIKNNIIEDIVRDGEVFMKNQNLMNSIYKLKQLNLLKHHNMGIKRFPGIGKECFVFNDYHAKSTNNGYSRNFGGVFFTR